MFKFSVSALAIIAVMMSFPDPAWSNEGDEIVGNGGAKRKCQENNTTIKTEPGEGTDAAPSALKKRKTETDNESNTGHGTPSHSGAPQPSFEGIPPEVRLIIYDYLFSQTPTDAVRDLMHLGLVNSSIHAELFGELRAQTERLKRSIPHNGIEMWQRNIPAAYFQANELYHTLEDLETYRKTNDNLKLIETYLNALEDNSPISQSRTLILGLLINNIRDLLFQWGQESLNPDLNPSDPIRAEQMNKQKAQASKLMSLGKKRALNMLASLWSEYIEKKSYFFYPQQYRALLEIFYFVANTQSETLEAIFPDIKDHFDKLLNTKTPIDELIQYPDAQLFCIANMIVSPYGKSLNYHYAFPSMYERIYLALSTKGNAEGQFNLANSYLTKSVGCLLEEDKDFNEFYANEILDLFPETPLPVNSEKFTRPLCTDKEASDEYKKAGAFWFGKAAGQGHPEALNNYGICHLTGTGVTQDFHRAFQLFKASAEKGSAIGQFNLGVGYENGWGTEQNHTLAFGAYQQAAEQGMGPAKFTLGLYYELGRGVDQDFEKAAMWYQRTIKDNDPFKYDNYPIVNLPYQGLSLYDDMPWNNLGRLYELGLGVEKDPEKAFELYQSYYNRSDESLKNYIRCLLQGIGTIQNLSLAENVGYDSFDFDKSEEYTSFLKELSDVNLPPLRGERNNVALISR